MTPCKHLDYEQGKYGPDIALKDCSPDYPMVRYWLRGDRWTDNGPGQTPNPAEVQFCQQGHRRITGIFQCYQQGEMPCYEPN